MAARQKCGTWKPDHGGNYCYTPRAPSQPATQNVTLQGGLAVTLVGGADAFGTSTLASANVELHILDRGLASMAVGSASFTAIAQSPEAGEAFAASYADVEVADGAYVKVDTRTMSSADGASQTSLLQFAALDLKLDLCPTASSRTDTQLSQPDTSISGNLAVFDVSVTALGPNSYTDAAVDALAFEGALSSVTVSATAAVDATVEYVMTTGTARKDTIAGGPEASLIFAGGGHDIVRSGAGDDWAFGEAGNDLLDGGDGADTLFGGVGQDRLAGGEGEDWLYGGHGCDDLAGGQGGDFLGGGADSDRMTGGDGNDIMDGGTGRDVLSGGNGDDVFWLGHASGDGNDVYTGGEGADYYILAGKFGHDTIADFSASGGDRLVLTTDVSIVMQRSAKDLDDLVLTLRVGSSQGVLTLDEFFKLNPGHNDMPRDGSFNEPQVAELLALLATAPDTAEIVVEAIFTFKFGDLLSDLG